MSFVAALALMALAADGPHSGAASLSTRLLDWTVMHQPEQNVMISSWSVEQAVGMLRLGAKGETDRELAQFLGSKLGPADSARAHQELLEHMAALVENGVLTSANGIWLREGETIRDEFAYAAQSHFGAAIEATEFPHPGVGRINTFVSQNTNGMIDELFRELPASTVMVLVNALAFKDDWKAPFNASLTRPRAFWAAKGEVQVPTMARTGSFDVRRHSSVLQVRLQYVSGMWMVLTVPDAPGGLEQVIKDSGWLDSATPWNPEQVELWLPKWKSESKIDLKEAMMALGVRQVFDSAQADLSGIQEPRGLFVSEAVHKTAIVVDEKGTEAAAATGIAMTRGARLDAPPRIAFDRPFAYAIHLPDGTPVFAGVVQRP